MRNSRAWCYQSRWVGEETLAIVLKKLNWTATIRRCSCWAGREGAGTGTLQGWRELLGVCQPKPMQHPDPLPCPRPWPPNTGKKVQGMLFPKTQPLGGGRGIWGGAHLSCNCLLIRALTLTCRSWNASSNSQRVPTTDHYPEHWAAALGETWVRGPRAPRAFLSKSGKP